MTTNSVHQFSWSFLLPVADDPFDFRASQICKPLSQRHTSNFSVFPGFPQWSLKYPFEGITIACFPVRKQVFDWTNKWCWPDRMKKEMSFVHQVNRNTSVKTENVQTNFYVQCSKGLVWANTVSISQVLILVQMKILIQHELAITKNLAYRAVASWAYCK